MNNIEITKVVTRNYFADIWSTFQNLTGNNLTAYEKMVQKGLSQIKEELGETKLEWYRYQISQLTNGAVIIMLYGEEKDE